jgi:hypothetical protein
MYESVGIWEDLVGGQRNGVVLAEVFYIEEEADVSNCGVLDILAHILEVDIHNAISRICLQAICIPEVPIVIFLLEIPITNILRIGSGYRMTISRQRTIANLKLIPISKYFRTFHAYTKQTIIVNVLGDTIGIQCIGCKLNIDGIEFLRIHEFVGIRTAIFLELRMFHGRKLESQ